MIIGLTVLLKLRLTTDGHTMTAYAALAKRRAVKKTPKNRRAAEIQAACVPVYRQW